MPRSHGIPYEIHPSPKKDAEGRSLLYVRPRKRNKISTEGIEQFCHNHLALPLGEFKRVFISFQEAAKWYLSEGMTVETPIGTFAPVLRLRREETDPKKITANDIYFDTITFTPNKDFLLEVGNRIRGFHKATDLCGNSQMYDKELMLSILNRILDNCNGMTTARQFQALSGLSYFSARKYLDALCGEKNPIIRRKRLNKTYIYCRE
ncbi:MAG: hypothetical protein IJ190_08550 [Prevotella sp.]|nr:hypothetical protein [Prevotella sp.]